MTNPLAVSKEEQDRIGGSVAIAQELRQFRRLAHYSDEDVAFRMASSLQQVRELRKMMRQDNIPLRTLAIPYRIRLILGSHKIKTTGQLFRRSDEILLAMPGIGPRSLEIIREALKERLQ